MSNSVKISTETVFGLRRVVGCKRRITVIARRNNRSIFEIEGQVRIKVVSHFDILAPVYDRIVRPFLGSLDHELWRKLLELPVDGRLLDAGGGTGRVSALVDSLHHFPRQRQVIRELARVISPGGLLVIEEFDIRRLPVKGLALLENLVLMGICFVRLKEIWSLVLKEGLTAEVREGERFSVFIVPTPTWPPATSANSARLMNRVRDFWRRSRTS